ncbi:MAG: hypothetical protein KatS3mg023_1469 [Armatimonadota bacterium]|nr:MAG: hypothetical protein KatS3mg023_1469 [Armatimonadota bacterium]
MNVAVHRQSVEDRRWAKELLREHAMPIDRSYLRARAEQEGTAQALQELWQEVRARMPRMRWSDLQERRREQLTEMMERGKLKRQLRIRPRDLEDERVLSLLVRLRWQKWLASGKVQILSPRCICKWAGHPCNVRFRKFRVICHAFSAACWL